MLRAGIRRSRSIVRRGARLDDKCVTLDSLYYRHGASALADSSRPRIDGCNRSAEKHFSSSAGGEGGGAGDGWEAAKGLDSPVEEGEAEAQTAADEQERADGGGEPSGRRRKGGSAPAQSLNPGERRVEMCSHLQLNLANMTIGVIDEPNPHEMSYRFFLDPARVSRAYRKER